MTAVRHRLPKLKPLREISLRDLLVVVLPLVLLIAGGFYLASRYIQPAPPSRLVISTGGGGGAYQRFAAAYRDVLARYDVELVEHPSNGALENLQRLRDGAQKVDAGFYQGGLDGPQEQDGLTSLGGLYYEPLWIFFREAAFRNEPDRITQLAGKRIAIGGAGSGTQVLARQLLRANGLEEKGATLIEAGGLGLAEQFAAGKIDVAFVVGPTQSATVWTLLYTPGVKPMGLAHAEAYTRQFPSLSRIVLPEGGVDVGRNIPSHDLALVAPMATLLVREDTHPALVDLLMQTAIEVHGGPGVFQKPGDFPKAQAVDFPLSSEAARYYKSGKPLLQRYLPFWAATLVDRMVVMLIPFFALVIPLVKIAPGLYAWRVRSRIYQRYGELKFLEAEVEATPERYSREEWLAKLDAIEEDANGLPTPISFSDMLYTLRGHIDLVRAIILKRTVPAAERPGVVES